MKSQTSPHPKLVYQYAQRLRWTWYAWLGFLLVIMPIVMKMGVSQAKTSVAALFVWQALKAMPALIATPYIHRANNAYALIVISLMMMVYLGVSASQWLIHWYESAPMALIVGYGIESSLLLLLMVWLFILLKKMPAMHKQTDG
ncbi:MAG: hypothetical protein Q4C68_05560 [Moraxella sp.]|nr:hypothetical protein [Moraxella sp.]